MSNTLYHKGSFPSKKDMYRYYKQHMERLRQSEIRSQLDIMKWDRRLGYWFIFLGFFNYILGCVLLFMGPEPWSGISSLAFGIIGLISGWSIIRAVKRKRNKLFIDSL